MTNEVAIHNLFVLKLRSKLTSDKEALDMAIKVLEQQPCEDCISRKRVIMLIDEATEKYPYKIIGLSDTYSNYNQGWTDACDWLYANIESDNLPSVTPKASEQQPSREWKEIYAESEGSNSWIEFKCPHCGYSFGMESGEYDWHYGDEIPWKYCPICGGSAEHKPYKAESEDKE